jgi:hypothetical protein
MRNYLKSGYMEDRKRHRTIILESILGKCIVKIELGGVISGACFGVNGVEPSDSAVTDSIRFLSSYISYKRQKEIVERHWQSISVSQSVTEASIQSAI